jgi:hypothetical protein
MLTLHQATIGHCSVEIGYGIMPSQQERRFAVELLVKEGF